MLSKLSRVIQSIYICLTRSEAVPVWYKTHDWQETQLVLENMLEIRNTHSGIDPANFTHCGQQAIRIERLHLSEWHSNFGPTCCLLPDILHHPRIYVQILLRRRLPGENWTLVNQESVCVLIELTNQWSPNLSAIPWASETRFRLGSSSRRPQNRVPSGTCRPKIGSKGWSRSRRRGSAWGHWAKRLERWKWSPWWGLSARE